jgi:hypothetical protein
LIREDRDGRSELRLGTVPAIVAIAARRALSTNRLAITVLSKATVVIQHKNDLRVRNYEKEDEICCASCSLFVHLPVLLARASLSSLLLETRFECIHTPV